MWKVMDVPLTAVIISFPKFPPLVEYPTTVFTAGVIGLDEPKLAKLIIIAWVNVAYPVVPERPARAVAFNAFAPPCGVSVVPLHKKSPPEVTVAPVSIFIWLFADKVGV